MATTKICGVNTAAAFDAVIEAGAAYLGFNFFPPSPRYVTPATAAALSARHAGGPQRVGLFVEPDDEAVAAVLAALPLDALQIYAAPARVAALRQKFRRPAWLPVSVDGADSLPRTADGVDLLLLDAQAPAGATRPGGNARAFDWSLLHGWAAPLPWALAGGLTPDNVADAIRRSGASTVDVSSGVEQAPGAKDPALIRAFVAAAHGQA